MKNAFDILIIGGGIVGLSSALALAEVGYSVGLVEARTPELCFSNTIDTARVSALHRGSLHFLQTYGLLGSLRACSVAPLEKIVVHTRSAQIMSPKSLIWEAALAGNTEVGQIVENRELLRVLWGACLNHSGITCFYPCPPQRLENPYTLRLESGETLAAKLLIGADGADSWLRREVGSVVNTRSYQHTALTAVLKTEYTHAYSAYQVFQVERILGILPLADLHKVAIVWSMPEKQAEVSRNLSEADFSTELAKVFPELGKLVLASQITAWPLVERHVRMYFNKPNRVLLGDAAHTIHPLAGQGLNLGLMDVRHLARTLGALHPRELDTLQAVQALRRYSFLRYQENQKMLYAMRFLKNICAHRETIFHTLYNGAFSLLNKLPCLKKYLMHCAMYTGFSEIE